MARAPKTITVAAGQIAARLMNEAPATLASIDAAITRAAEKRVDLLVLPECAYPAYLVGSVQSYREGEHLTSEAFLDWLSQKAAQHHLHIVSGFVEDAPDSLFNSAILFDDRGKEVGRTRKRFLWNADHDWFGAGEEIQPFETLIGRIGIVICAETRAPEIIATLVAEGTELIVMPTCWINNAREPGQYENPQVEFLMEARAREFRVPFVCADKYGQELGTVGYVGQSRIIRAGGSVAAEAPATGQTVIAARLVRNRPPRVWVNEHRRSRLLSGQPPVRPPAAPSRPVTVAAIPTAAALERLGEPSGETFFGPLRKSQVHLLMVNLAQEAQAEKLSMLARAFDIRAVGFPERADVFSLGPARVGCVAGQWARSFVACRTLALEGAELLMFFDAPDDLPILRTRAMENRVFILGANERSALIIGPDGDVLAHTGTTRNDQAVAQLDLAQAGDKSVAPRTDVFSERRVGLYRF